MRIKGAKKSKDRLGQRQLVYQEDYYSEATEYEEQAERWMLSDIKKTLRFYQRALDLYEAGLKADGATLKGTYNIMYNKTRLLLHVHTSYIANSGYMDLLQYVNLEDLQGISILTMSLTEIVKEFEDVFEQFSEIRTWDLESNLLTCYLTLLEAADEYSLSSEDVVQLTTKFAELTQHSLNFQVSELQKFQSVESEDGDMAQQSVGAPVDPEPSPERAEYMEQADQVTSETILDVLVGAYKFIQILMEIILENRLGNPSDIRLNSIQANFLDDLASSLSTQVDDIHASIRSTFALEEGELAVVLDVNRGIKIVSGGDIVAVEQYISDGLDSTNVSLLLGRVDVLIFAISCLKQEETPEVEWKLCSLLNKLLATATKVLSSQRIDISSGKSKNLNDQLSHIVFQLCDVLINSSDNELRRWQIKAHAQGDGAHKTREVLMKNAKTLLINALKISERPCGIEEYIVDKLKRNYIYKQAETRLNALTNPKQSDFAQISDLLSEHPFYKNLNHI